MISSDFARDVKVLIGAYASSKALVILDEYMEKGPLRIITAVNQIDAKVKELALEPEKVKRWAPFAMSAKVQQIAAQSDLLTRKMTLELGFKASFAINSLPEETRQVLAHAELGKEAKELLSFSSSFQFFEGFNVVKEEESVKLTLVTATTQYHYNQKMPLLDFCEEGITLFERDNAPSLIKIEQKKWGETLGAMAKLAPPDLPNLD